MNSLLSHKTRRYGQWTLMRFVNEVGTSHFVCFSERNADGLHAADGGDPRQDDYDIWLGTGIIKPWIAHDRHTPGRQLPLPRRPRLALAWDAAVDMYPDKVVLTQDGILN